MGNADQASGLTMLFSYEPSGSSDCLGFKATSPADVLIILTESVSISPITTWLPISYVSFKTRGPGGVDSSHSAKQIFRHS